MNEGPPNTINNNRHASERAEENGEFYSTDEGETAHQKKSEYSVLMTKNFLNELTSEEESRLNYLTSQMSRIRSGDKVQSEEDFKKKESSTEERETNKVSREDAPTTDSHYIVKKPEAETRPNNMSEHAFLKTKFFNGNLTPQEEERLNYLEINMDRLRQKEEPDRQVKIKGRIAEVKKKEQLRQEEEESRLKKTSKPWWKRIFGSRM
jgi:hypothetical protein